MIEQALSSGETVLIENLPEKVDPVLEPLLGRNTIKRGRFVVKLQRYIYSFKPALTVNHLFFAYQKLFKSIYVLCIPVDTQVDMPTTRHNVSVV